jgi:hypothetical protein
LADDSVKIRIEIETQDTTELKNIERALDEAEKKLYRIKSDKIAKGIFESEGAPISRDDKGPIFRGEEESEAVSELHRTGKGKQAISRQDAFKNLQNRVDDMEKEQLGLKEVLSGVGLTLSGGGILGAFKSQLTKFIPYIGEALVAIGFIETIVNKLLEPGGVWDRRWKFIVEKLVADKTKRETLSAIRQRFQDVRIASWIGPRGARQGQLSTTLRGGNTNQYIYDDKLERLQKGLYP